MNKSIVELYSANEIAARVEQLAAEIKQKHEGDNLIVLGVLEDSFVFLADLLRRLDLPVYTNFLRFDHRSFGGLQDLSFSTQADIRNQNVLLVEGVLETGVTQAYILAQLKERGAANVEICVLVDKPDRRRASIEPDWRAFETHEDYVFGYGLGFHERFRELPFLATFAREDGTKREKAS